jgi:formylglycine-generating enzyme required for sulfatase activity
MLRYEVSVAEYRRCQQARRCKPLPYFRGGQRFAREHYPASLASWHDARDYCTFIGARLPSEAEFERAARGLSRRTYPWGDLYNQRVSNHGRLASDPTSDTDGHRELAPVGSYPSGGTPEGIFDLAGNVAEWVWDRYAPEYPEHDERDPMGPIASSGSNQRVVRGGAFQSPRPDLRGAARAGRLPTQRSPGLGFRCVLGAVSTGRPR